MSGQEGEHGDNATSSNRNGSTNRDGRASRPKVQQLRPTNKTTPINISDPPTASGSAQIPTANISAAGNSTDQQGRNNITTNIGGNQRVVPRIVTGQGSGSSILVNSRQQRNPILALIKNIPWEYGDIVPDFQVGLTSCALFLSLRYHRLHPEYIHQRIEKLGKMYTLRILLVSCDVDQPESAIKELTKVALIHDLTVMVGWNSEELARYLELYKKFENKPPDLIKERINDDFLSHYTSALTNIRGVNKTDVQTLATQIGSFSDLSNCTSEQLANCPGIGEKKSFNIIDALHQPFRAGHLQSYRERRILRESEIAVDDALEESHRKEVQDEVEKRRQREQQVPQDERQYGLPETNVLRPSLTSTVREDDALQLAASALEKDTVTEADLVRQESNQTDLDVEDDIEDFDDMLEGLTEEERLQLALEMSISGANADQ